MTRRMLIAAFAVACVVSLDAQDKPRPEARASLQTPLYVQVVLTRYDGDKKVSSMPYSLLVNASDDPRPVSLRMGVQVPIRTVVKDVPTFTYKDVGTDIDCSALRMDDGRFRLGLTVRQSSLYVGELTSKGGTLVTAEGGAKVLYEGTPALRSFGSDFYVIMRDGQTTQLTTATDPVNGNVLKVDVTVNVAK